MAARWFDVRRGEHGRVVRAGAAMFAILGGFTIAETARDSLFLGSNGANQLAIAYLLIATVAIGALFANAWLVRSVGRKRALIVTLLIAAAGTAAFAALPREPAAGLALYLWTGLIGTVVVVQFWLLAATRFTTAEAKRLYGPIAASGALGTLVGAVAAWALLQALPIEALLVVAAGFYVVGAALLMRDQQNVEPRLGAAPTMARARVERTKWRGRGYVTQLALLTICATAAALLADWLFKSAAASRFHTEELARFIARFNGVVATLSLIFQLVGAAWLARRLGVLGMALLLPALMLFGGVGAMLGAGAFFVACATKGADGSLRYSVNRVATELLWMPVSDQVRTSVREPLESAVTRLVQATTAAILLGLVTVGLARPTIIAALLAVIAAIWTLTAAGLRNRYLGQLRQSVTRRTFDDDDQELDAKALSDVVDALSSEDERRVVAAIQILVGRGRASAIPALILRHDSLAVLSAALAAMTVPGRTDWVEPARRLLRSADPRTRMLALRALAGLGDETAIIDGLCDDDVGVVAHAVFWSLRREPESALRGSAALIGLLAEPGARGETAARELLEAIRSDGDARWAEVLLELAILRGSSDELIEPLARAIEHVPDRRLIPFLIDRLGARVGRPDVRRALLAMGDPALDALATALESTATSRRARLHLPTTIAMFGSARAGEVLADQLVRETSGAVRYRVLRALAQMAVRDELMVPAELLLAELREHLDEHSRLLALSIPLVEAADPMESAMLLRGILADKIRQALERAFLALQALHPREHMREIARAVAGTDPRARAHAGEFLDTLTRTALYGRPEVRGIRLSLSVLGEDLDARERLARASSTVVVPESVADAVARLIHEPDTLLSACAAYHALEIGSRPLLDVIDEEGQRRQLFAPLGIYHASVHASG